MAEASKNLANKNQVKTRRNLTDKNWEKIYFIGKSDFHDDDGSQNYLTRFLCIFKLLMVILIKSFVGKLESSQKIALQLLLHQTIVLLQNLLIFIIPK